MMRLTQNTESVALVMASD